MKKVICIGSACKDVFFPTQEGIVLETPDDLMSQKKIAFELGAKYKIETRYESLGGCAANVASGLSRLGAAAACYSRTGDDLAAEWIKKELEKNGADTSLITAEKKCPSDLSAIVVDEKSGDRVIFSNQKANSYLEITPEKIKNSEWLFIGDLHGNWEQDMDEIIKTAKNNNIKIALNPRQINIHDNVGKVIETIRLSDVIFLNKDEAIEAVSGLEPEASEENMNDEIFLVKSLKELGPAAVALTDGLRGAWGYDGKTLAHIGAAGSQPVDTTGAGDAFASGFLAAYLKEKTLKVCLKWGTANAGNSINFYGGIKGLLKENEIGEKANKIEVEIIG